MAGQAASSAGGAAKYLAGLKQSAESFFLSTLIVQAGFAGFVIIAHLALNWKLKKKLGKVPAALAFPKFEVVILMAFFESVCQTCLVTIAASNSAGYVVLAIMWLLCLLSFVGYLIHQLWRFSKEKRGSFEPQPAGGGGHMYHMFILPLKMFKARCCFQAPEDASKGTWKARVSTGYLPLYCSYAPCTSPSPGTLTVQTTIPLIDPIWRIGTRAQSDDETIAAQKAMEDRLAQVKGDETDATLVELVSKYKTLKHTNDQEQYFMGGYSELFMGYDGPNILFFGWVLIEQLIRVLILTFVKGIAASVLLSVFAIFGLLVALWRRPFVDRKENIGLFRAKLIEVCSFLPIAIAAGTGSGPETVAALLAVAPVVLLVNQVSAPPKRRIWSLAQDTRERCACGMCMCMCMCMCM